MLCKLTVPMSIRNVKYFFDAEISIKRVTNEK